jgi:hypothetical protein
MMVQKMSVAEDPGTVTELTTNFERTNSKETNHPWSRAWKEAVI